MPIDARPHLPVHIVWDWNGTLRDDLDDHVAALNQTLPELGGAPVSADTYRARHRMPVRRFYDDLLGYRLDDTQWQAADTAFLTALGRRPVRLHRDARQLMLLLGTQGVTQSLLSLTPHHRLQSEVGQTGLGGLLARIDGRHGPAGPKAQALSAHLAALAPDVEGARTIVIGDSCDDALAAHAVGAIAVLFTGGLSSRARLAAAGVPVVDTLEDAVAAGLAALTPRPALAAHG